MSEGISSAEFIRRSIEPSIQGKIDNSIRSAQREGREFDPNNKQDRFDAYLGRLEQIFTDKNPERQQRKIKIFKEKFVYPNVLIDKDNIPDSYFALQLKIARERGQGGDYQQAGIKEVKDIPLSMRREAGKIIYTDQKKRLDTWFDYLSSPDADVYDSWFKYYTLKSVVKLGNYDKEKKQFSKRTRDTTGIFPDLNREALAFTYDVIKKHHLQGVKEGDNDFKRLLESANFGKIYAYAIDKVTPASKENKEKIEGEWTKYDQGSDPTPLYESLQGHGTEWCIAGEEVAKKYLSQGDIYVYYSKDETNKNTIPRVAIRMENGQVTEVRGINSNQNMEANMIDIASEKYHQLPGGEKFDKKDHDMKLLTLIENKTNNNQELSKDELKFLYEIENKIEGFGYTDDPRIKEIKGVRDEMKDLTFIFDCRPDQISFTQKKALNSDIKFHKGDLYLSIFSLDELGEGLKFPEIITGNLKLPSLTSAEGLKLPETINGNLFLENLTSAKGLKFPKIINGSIKLDSLTSAEGLILPETINGNLFLPSLTSAEGLILPETINGTLFLGRLTSAEGLILPETINGSLSLENLTSAKGLKFPKTINGYIYLTNLTSAKGLVLPETINGNVILTSLTSTEGLILPETINGKLVLGSLTSAEKQSLKEKHPNIKIVYVQDI